MQWVPKLAGVLWDGMIMQSEQMCHELLGDRYFRWPFPHLRLLFLLFLFLFLFLFSAHVHEEPPAAHLGVNGGGLGLRFNPVLQTEIPLDNPEAVPLLVDIALNVRSSSPPSLSGVHGEKSLSLFARR
jgi:hypothetical protein